MTVSPLFSNTEHTFFDINIFLLNLVGLWPYETKRKQLVRKIFVISLLCISSIPFILGINKHCGSNLAVCTENVGALLYLVGIFYKYLTTIYVEKKLCVLYRNLFYYWKYLHDDEEKRMLLKYTSLGKIRFFSYSAYITLTMICFSQLFMYPVVLDYILPLNETRQRILITRGEYIVDPYDNYFKIYIFSFVVYVVALLVLIAADATYVVVVHQNLGLIRIIQQRIKLATEHPDKSQAYKILISAIELHNKTLDYINQINSAYDITNFGTIGFCVPFISVSGVCILENIQHMVDVVKMSLIQIGYVIYVFYISWQGQIIIDGSNDLFISTYANEWYNVPKRAKTLLKIMMLRCMEPSYLTAAGFYRMNFENYGTIVKTTVSYMTVLMSFRA